MWNIIAFLLLSTQSLTWSSASTCNLHDLFSLLVSPVISWNCSMNIISSAWIMLLAAVLRCAWFYGPWKSFSWCETNDRIMGQRNQPIFSLGFYTRKLADLYEMPSELWLVKFIIYLPYVNTGMHISSKHTAWQQDRQAALTVAITKHLN